MARLNFSVSEDGFRNEKAQNEENQESLDHQTDSQDPKIDEKRYSGQD